MASSGKKTGAKSKNNVKNVTKRVDEKVEDTKKDTFIMKTLVFLGTVFLIATLVYLMYFFFVKHSDIKINMSTDKKVLYMTFNGEEELVTTQKYVSDLDYSMRYDVKKISVFKYKDQDIFKFNDAEKILVVVEHAKVPSNCTSAPLDNSYNSCTIAKDDYTLEYYISLDNKTFKITVKTPNGAREDETIQKRIDYMLYNFSITA